MAEEKKEFQFVTEVPKNVWGPEFEDIFVYPVYDEGKVAMEITVAKGVTSQSLGSAFYKQGCN